MTQRDRFPVSFLTIERVDFTIRSFFLCDNPGKLEGFELSLQKRYLYGYT